MILWLSFGLSCWLLSCFFVCDCYKKIGTLYTSGGGSNCSFCSCDRQSSNLAPKISHLLFYTFFQFKHPSRWCCEENLQKWFNSQISCPRYAGWVKPKSCFFKGTGHFLMLERCKVWERIRCQGDSLLLALGIKGGCVTRSTGRYEGLKAAPNCQLAWDGPPNPPTSRNYTWPQAQELERALGEISAPSTPRCQLCETLSWEPSQACPVSRPAELPDNRCLLSEPLRLGSFVTQHRKLIQWHTSNTSQNLLLQYHASNYITF